jgi:hypothetical protein
MTFAIDAIVLVEFAASETKIDNDIAAVGVAVV